jgi:hypothetical protein
MLDDRQLLEYTGLVKRRDLCRQEQLEILYKLLRQPAQVLASIAWPKYGQIGALLLLTSRYGISLYSITLILIKLAIVSWLV